MDVVERAEALCDNGERRVPYSHDEPVSLGALAILNSNGHILRHPLNSSEEQFSQSRCFQIITCSMCVLSLLFLLLGVFQLIGILIKGVRGECFLVGAALVLDFFLVLFWSYFRGEAWRERRIRLGWAQHGMLSRSKAQLPSSVNSSVRFFVLFLTLHFSLF
jgi:hypothetical protein